MAEVVKIPASSISEDVALVMESAPFQPPNWDALTLENRIESATWDQLRALARGGVGEPEEGATR